MTRLYLAVLGISSCLAALTAGPAVAQFPAGGGPLSVSEVLAISEFADRNQLDLSPDGRLVAFALDDPRRSGRSGSGSRYFDAYGVPRGHVGTDVYVADIRTGETRRLGDGTGSSWAPVWSPDGRYLAFYSDRDGLARLWIWDTEPDRLSRVSDAVVRTFFGFEQVQWSPDSRTLLVKLLPESMTFEDLERLLPQAPATRTATAAEPAAPGAVTARVFRYEPEASAQTDPAEAQPGDRAPGGVADLDLDAMRSFLNVELADLALVDVASGQVRRIAPRVRAMGYRFDPSGKRVAFSTRQPDGGIGTLVYDRYDLWVVDTAGGPVRSLAPGTVQEYGLRFSWSPDGRRIAYESEDAIDVVRAADGAPIRSFAPEDLPFRNGYRAPLWMGNEALIVPARDTLRRLSLESGEITAIPTADGRRLLEVVAPADAQWLDGPRVLVAVSEGRSKRMGLQWLDLRSGEATPLFEDDIGLGGTNLAYQLDTSGDGAVAFVAESGGRPAEVWVVGSGLERPRRVTDLNPQVTGRPLGESQLVEWVDEEGRDLQGALLLPAGYQPGRRYPLVVRVYGGSRLSWTVNRFGLEGGIDNLQLLATRGYAVLLPDAPAREGSPAANIAAAVRAGIEAVVELGVADPDRVAVLGHSYGGYSALAVATRVPGLAAVISSGGFSNLLSQYAEMREDGSVVGIGWSEQGQGRMPGHPWEHRETYIENSPFFALDRVTAPVLLLHGAADHTVLVQRARETFVGLRRLGKPVTLVAYEGEDHHPGSWSAENAADFWARIFDWLERHVDP